MATVTLKCPNCGGDLRFDPASQKYKCEYCLSSFTQAELDQIEKDIQPESGAEDGEKAEDPTGKMRQQAAASSAVIYNCPSCGAEIVTDETTAATFCFYCHNPVILQGKLEGRYHPDYVLPFEVDRDKAKSIFLTWLKQKKFVPKSFYSPEQIEKMTGVYFPYWLYSCRADGRLEAEGLKQESRIVGNTRQTENRKFSISRAGQMDVKNVARNALKKADRKLAEGVLPFEMKNLQPFTIGYLSGFVAEKRDIESQEYTREVEEEIRGYAANNLMESVSDYTNVQVKSQEVELKDSRWDYALMPVWTLTYRDEASGQIYYFACNGQTGKVCGVLPVDKAKLAVFFAEIFVPLFVILLVVGYFI